MLLSHIWLSDKELDFFLCVVQLFYCNFYLYDLYLRRKSHFSLMRCQSSCKKTDSDVSQRLFSLQPVSYQGLTSAVPCYSCLWLCVCHTLQRWASKQGASGVRRSTGTFIMALCTPPTCHTHTHAGYTLSQKQNSALVPGNRQVTYKWWIWQCCGAAAECCKKKREKSDWHLYSILRK